MKVKFTGTATRDHYRGVGGFWRPGDVREVTASEGAYLLDTFPGLFAKVSAPKAGEPIASAPAKPTADRKAKSPRKRKAKS